LTDNDRVETGEYNVADAFRMTASIRSQRTDASMNDPFEMRGLITSVAQLKTTSDILQRDLTAFTHKLYNKPQKRNVTPDSNTIMTTAGSWHHMTANVVAASTLIAITAIYYITQKQ